MNAATYVRSSKDAHAVSLAAQQRELVKLAAARGLSIVETYEDAVQAGSTENRPGFRRLLADLKRPGRPWSVLLVYDTSRIARGRYIAQAFKHQCRRLGCEILYARMPETDPVSAVILESVFEAMDEVHSILSREKGLAGMRENVRQGWRAGGRAPWGYRLVHESTGAVRNGQPVLKSHLEKSADAPVVQRYLTARAAGVPRVRAARDAGVRRPHSTLIDVEWNALVYAGCTVWNRHAEKKARGSGRPRRRPRAEWEIHEGTHDALLSRAEAEAILRQLETSDIGRAVAAAKASMSGYLLTGLLETSAGQRWIGAGRYYRLRKGERERGTWIRCAELDAAVLRQIRVDMTDEGFLRELARAVSATADGPEAAPVRQELARLERQKERGARLALETDDPVYTRLVGELSCQIEALRHEAAALDAQDQAREEIARITPTKVREILLGLDSPRALLAGVEKVVLEPELTCRIHYSLSMASPRGFGRWTAGVVREVRLRAVGAA